MEITISESHYGLEILKLIDELLEMPEYEIYLDLMALNTSLFTLDRNYEDFITTIDRITNNPEIDHIFQPSNRDVLHRLSQEITMRIHNFVASVSSLRDHTRRLYQNLYEKKNLMPEYDSKKREAFIDSPNSQFVQ